MPTPADVGYESAWAIAGPMGPSPWVQRDRRDLKVLRGINERRVTKGTSVRAVQLDATVNGEASEMLVLVFVPVLSVFL
jgi:hypothetical protein